MKNHFYLSMINPQQDIKVVSYKNHFNVYFLRHELLFCYSYQIFRGAKWEARLIYIGATCTHLQASERERTSFTVLLRPQYQYLHRRFVKIFGLQSKPALCYMLYFMSPKLNKKSSYR